VFSGKRSQPVSAKEDITSFDGWHDFLITIRRMNTVRAPRIIFCSTPGREADSIRDRLGREGIHCESYASIDKALASLENGKFDTFVLRVCDEEDDIQQLEKLTIVRKIDPDLPAIIISEIDSIKLERAARLQEVFYFQVEPVNVEELKEVLVQSVQLRLRRAERRMG
jgi:DNA-binding NtrC family response regulator